MVLRLMMVMVVDDDEEGACGIDADGDDGDYDG